MKTPIEWLKGTISGKGLVLAMSCYKIAPKAILATDGAIIASYPWSYVGPETLIPAKELEQILNVMAEDPRLTHESNRLKLQSGSFKANLPLFPADQWGYPGIDEKAWKPVPPRFIEALASLRPFLSTNATQPWATCIYFKDNYAYATNNIIIVGCPCPNFHIVKDSPMLLPLGAVDFLLKRPGIVSWQRKDNYAAFKWESGAWMRTQLVDRTFPKTGVDMVQEAWTSTPTQKITPQFKAIVERFGTFTETAVRIYKDKVVGKFQEALIEETVQCEVSNQKDHTIWAVEQLQLVTQVATHWQPSTWPQPCPFKGDKIAGVIVGRLS